jgi:hypothetical protein
VRDQRGEGRHGHGHGVDAGRELRLVAGEDQDGHQEEAGAHAEQPGHDRDRHGEKQRQPEPGVLAGAVLGSAALGEHAEREVADGDQVQRPQPRLAGALSEPGAQRGARGGDRGEHEGRAPGDQAALGEPDGGEDRGDPVEEQAERLHLVHQVGHEEAQERHRGERDAEAEHP